MSVIYLLFFLCVYFTTTLTLQAISANALSDNQMTLPQDSPHQVTRAAADLHNLPWYGHLLPNGALRIMMVDVTPEPHLLECTKKIIFMCINGNSSEFQELHSTAL